jgi:hypothetical protein
LQPIRFVTDVSRPFANNVGWFAIKPVQKNRILANNSGRILPCLQVLGGYVCKPLHVALFDKIVLRLVFAMCFGPILVFIVGTQWGGSVISEGLMGGVYGAIISGFAIDQLSYIKPIEKMGWSWKGFFNKSCLGILVGILSLGFIFAGFYMVADSQDTTVENLISNIDWNSEAGMLLSLKGNAMALFCIGTGGLGIFFMAISWIIFGIIGGVTNNISVNKVQPNQGIKMSFRNGSIALMVTGFIFGLVLVSASQMPLISHGLFLSLIIGAKLGLSGAVKHYTPGAPAFFAKAEMGSVRFQQRKICWRLMPSAARVRPAASQDKERRLPPRSSP